MPEWLAWTLGIIIFLFAISVSVGLHEAGHMTVARFFKIRVPRFFIGFGPTLWSKEKNGTEYGVKWLPLGGFVEIEDETQPEGSDERHMLSYISPWKRTLIFLAGPAVNIVLGVGILVGALMLVSTPTPSTTVGALNCAEGVSCGAKDAGIIPGDEIIKINGKNIKTFDDISFKQFPAINEVVILRDGETKTLDVAAGDSGFIGITIESKGKTKSFTESFASVQSMLALNMKAIAEVPSKVPNVVNSISGSEKRDNDSISSIVTIGKTYGDTVAEDTTAVGSSNKPSKALMLVMYTGLLNIGLGFANLIPLLPLDGGRILIAFIDAIRIRLARIAKWKYEPLPYKWVSAITAVTGFMLISFMLLVVVADIVAPVSL